MFSTKLSLLSFIYLAENHFHLLRSPRIKKKKKALEIMMRGVHNINPTISFHNSLFFGFPFSDEFVGKERLVLVGRVVMIFEVLMEGMTQKEDLSVIRLKDFYPNFIRCHYLKWKIFHFGSLEDFFAAFSVVC